MSFTEKKLTWRFYILIKALFIIKWIEFIIKKKFVKIVLDKKSEIFIIYIVMLKTLILNKVFIFSKLYKLIANLFKLLLYNKIKFLLRCYLNI